MYNNKHIITNNTFYLSILALILLILVFYPNQISAQEKSNSQKISSNLEMIIDTSHTYNIDTTFIYNDQVIDSLLYLDSSFYSQFLPIFQDKSKSYLERSEILKVIHSLCDPWKNYNINWDSICNALSESLFDSTESIELRKDILKSINYYCELKIQNTIHDIEELYLSSSCTDSEFRIMLAKTLLTNGSQNEKAIEQVVDLIVDSQITNQQFKIPVMLEAPNLTFISALANKLNKLAIIDSTRIKTSLQTLNALLMLYKGIESEQDLLIRQLVRIAMDSTLGESNRISAIRIIGKFSKSGIIGIPYLVEIIKSTQTEFYTNIGGLPYKGGFDDLTLTTITSLSNFGEASIPPLLALFNNDTTRYELKSAIAVLLSLNGYYNQEEALRLYEIIKHNIYSTNYDTLDFDNYSIKHKISYPIENYIACLQNLHLPGDSIFPIMMDVMDNTYPHLNSSVIEAISKVAKRAQEEEYIDILYSLKRTRDRIEVLDTAKSFLPWDRDNIKDIELSIQALEAIKKANIYSSLSANIQKFKDEFPTIYKIIVGIFIVVIIWLVSYFISYFINKYYPLKLYSFNLFLMRKVPGIKVGGTLIINVASLFPSILCFSYTSNMLDATVLKYLSVVRRSFFNKNTIIQRSIFIENKVRIDDKPPQYFSLPLMREYFCNDHTTIMIYGGGGVGKTSLTIQLALWAMNEDIDKRLNKDYSSLPVFIECDIEDIEDKNYHPLVFAIQDELKKSIGLIRPLELELINELLISGRIFVIIDGLSEMNKITKHMIKYRRSNLSANKLVITSRLLDVIEDERMITIKPEKIGGRSHLATFLDKYLDKTNKLETLSDGNFWYAGRDLLRILEKRKVTPLLVKLYAENIVGKNEFVFNDNRPSNIPELMLAYLNEINRASKKDSMLIHDRTVQRVAKAIAWESIKENLHPTTFLRDSIINILNQENDVESLLQYFEEDLRLIQTVGISEDKIIFNEDFLAEYLGSLYLVEKYGSNYELWNSFITRLELIDTESTHKQNFKSILYDCIVHSKIISDLSDDILDSIKP